MRRNEATAQRAGKQRRTVKKAASSRRSGNTVRIIGGVWRSRLVHFPDAPDLRPTPDRIRETLFNWLGQDLSGLICLDLFAGSGALGFEALSRGAAAVTLVENNRAAFAALQDNARQLGATGARLERIDALEFLAREPDRYDVIFLDPPFGRSLAEPFFAQLERHLAVRGRVYLESGEPFKGRPGWTVLRQGRAGNVHFHLLERATA